MWTMRECARTCANYLFPPHCFVCKEGGAVLCRRCIKKLSRAVESGSHSALSIFDYKDKNVRKIIHAVKYYRRKDLVSPLMERTVHELLLWVGDDEPQWVLCPIPMLRWRKYMRGYNQAEIIAEELSRSSGLRVVPFLKRSKVTIHQASTAKRAERLKAQKASFAVHADPRGANIILVDDVTTTGATLAEARNVLLAHGAISVRALTLAH